MKLFSFYILAFTPFYLSGQVVFSDEIVIDNQVLSPYSISAADIDGDGDNDVILADDVSDTISWYENLDGFGNFSPKKFINTQNGAKSVYAVDIDSDGDLDIIAGSEHDSTVAWYENLDGNGNFGDQNIVTTEASGAWSVFAADLDHDGDTDIISASPYDSKIAWYENKNGLGNFGNQIIISNTADRTRSVYAADFDNDGDIDVCAAIWGEEKIAWYENIDGQGSFVEKYPVSQDAIAATGVFAADIDGDGDMDVLSTSRHYDRVSWHENQDGLGNFDSELTISTDALGATSVYADDLDNDGDIDVLSASPYDHKIAWYENKNGLGNFGNENIISTDATLAVCVHAADLDGDGDLDVLAAPVDGFRIMWYENLLISTHTNKVIDNQKIQIAPNPFNEYTYISIGGLPLSTDLILEIQNSKGILMERHKVSNNTKIRIGNSQYSSGTYFFSLKTKNDNKVLDTGKFIKI